MQSSHRWMTAVIVLVPAVAVIVAVVALTWRPSGDAEPTAPAGANARPGDDPTITVANASAPEDVIADLADDPELTEDLSQLNDADQLHDVYRLPQLLSPAIAPNAAASAKIGPEVVALIEKHNALQQQLRQVDIVGQAEYVHSSEDASEAEVADGWNYGGSFEMQFDRDNEAAYVEYFGHMRSTPNYSRISGTTVTTYNDFHIAVTDQTMYLLMFRQFDPSTFEKAEDATITRQSPDGRTTELPVKVVTSENEQLKFEAGSGRLLQATFNLQPPRGPVTLDYDKFQAIDPTNAAEVPRTLVLTLPHDQTGDFRHRHDFRVTIDELRVDNPLE